MTQAIVTFNSTLPITYDVTEEQIELKRQAYAAIDLSAPGGYEACRLAIADCRETMVAIEERRKTLKAPALQWGNDVDAEAKRLSGMIAEIRTPLQEKKAVIDAAKAKAKREKEEAALAELAAQLKAEQEALEVARKAAQAAEEARLAAIAEANRIESERLATERAALEAAQESARQQQAMLRDVEEKRVAAERAKLEADRKAQEDRQRVAREQEEARLAAVRKEEEDRAAQARAEIEAERIKLESERLETARLERERLARIEADRETARLCKEAAEQIERERIAAEEARVKEAERQAAIAARLDALKPDAEKLHTYGRALGDVEAPELNSAEAREFLKQIEDDLVSIFRRVAAFGRTQEMAA